MLDTPEQETLTVASSCSASDNAGISANGGRWSADGGHMSGRKLPIVFMWTAHR